MATNRSILGGDSSKPKGDFPHGFFHADANVKYIVPRPQKNDVKFIRLLPAFDMNQDLSTPEGKASYVPFKDEVGSLTPWFFYVQGYTFLGDKNKQFVSPIVFESPESRYGARGVDPIRDCYLYARRHSDPKVQALTKQQGKRTPAIIPSVRDFALINAFVTKTDNSSQVAVLILTKTAMQDLEKQLTWRSGRSDPIISKQFDDLLYGDVTDPMTGLCAQVCEKTAEGASQYTYSGLSFSNEPMTLNGHMSHPINPNTQEGRDILLSRYNISDVDNVTCVPSYETMLEYIVEHTAIPYDLIVDACSPYTDVVPQRKIARNANLSPNEAAGAVSNNSGFARPSADVNAAVPTANVNVGGSNPSALFSGEESHEDIPVTEESTTAAQATETPASDWSDALEAEYQALEAKATSPDATVIAAFYGPDGQTDMNRYVELKTKRATAQL